MENWLRPQLDGGRRLNETDYKSELKKKLLEKQFRVMRFEDRFRAGIPDMLVYADKIQVWVESKMADKPADLTRPWAWKAFKKHQAWAAIELCKHSPGGVLFTAYCSQTKFCVVIDPYILLDAFENKTTVESYVYEGYGDLQIQGAWNAQRSAAGA
jgi:hypothetical protein